MYFKSLFFIQLAEDRLKRKWNNRITQTGHRLLSQSEYKRIDHKRKIYSVSQTDENKKNQGTNAHKQQRKSIIYIKWNVFLRRVYKMMLKHYTIEFPTMNDFCWEILEESTKKQRRRMNELERDNVRELHFVLLCFCVRTCVRSWSSIMRLSSIHLSHTHIQVKLQNPETTKKKRNSNWILRNVFTSLYFCLLFVSFDSCFFLRLFLSYWMKDARRRRFA